MADPGIWVRLERGIAKNNCPWDVSFEQDIQIPTYARVGGVELNIVRCITIVCNQWWSNSVRIGRLVKFSGHKCMEKLQPCNIVTLDI